MGEAMSTDLDAVIAKVETLRGACEDVLRVLKLHRKEPNPTQLEMLGEWVSIMLIATAKSRLGAALAKAVMRWN